jgi:hypothetical protein
MTTGRNGLRRGPPVKGSERRLATTELVDGSDLDISDSLPQDSPVLNGRGLPAAGRLSRTIEPVLPASSPPHQPVYASVVKKKKKPSNTSPPPPRVKSTNQQDPAALNKTMTDAPRSPAKIPLIRISQTESVERAEKNPPTPLTDSGVEHHQVFNYYF